jgi:hypothetical protein
MNTKMFLKNVNISCHHGKITKENQLYEAINIIKNNTEIDIIEIDFVCVNDEFISSHDYNDDMIKHGSILENWIHFIMLYNKILWIDLKDIIPSILINYSYINVELLYNKLNNMKKIYPNLNNHIIIGCQFQHGYNNLIKNNNNDYLIIKDTPSCSIYLIDFFTPACLKYILNDIAVDYIVKELNDEKYVAIDKRFINNTKTLIDIIDKIDALVIIIYNYARDESILNIKNKHIIYQYNYYN